MSKRRKLSYALVPAVFTGVMAMVFAFGIRPAAEAAMSGWRGAWIMGAPEYAYHENSSNLPVTGKAGEKRWEALVVGTQYGAISCEGMDWRVPLYYGDSEEILELGAGTYTGYSLPGEGKRILLGAHDTTYFSVLDQFEAGDVLVIDTVYGSYRYRVSCTAIADVSEALPEETGNAGEELILYTCYPMGETKEVRTERYLVYAEKLAKSGDGE